MAITFEKLMETVEAVRKAERITKAGLSTLSRDILAYMLEEEDIRPVNALLGQDDEGSFVLTPINWRIAVQYFHHFLPFTSNFEDIKEYVVKGQGKREPIVFSKKSKKKWDKCAKLTEEWLADEDNDIWVWSADIKMDAGEKDWRKEIQKVVLNAMGEGKGKQQGDLSLRDILDAMTELDQVDVYALMGAMEAAAVPHEEAA